MNALCRMQVLQHLSSVLCDQLRVLHVLVVKRARCVFLNLRSLDFPKMLKALFCIEHMQVHLGLLLLR